MSTNPLAGERSTRIPSEDGAPLTVKSFTAHCSSFLKQAIVIGLRNARPLKDAAECYGTAAWNWLLDLVRKFLELKPSALLAAFIAATTRSDSPVVRWIGQQLLKIPGAERIVAVVSKFVSKCAKILVKGLETLTKWWKVMSSYLPSTAVEKIEECAAWLASKASSFPFKSALRWLSAFLSLWAFATDAYSLVSGSYQAVLDQLKAGLGATDIPAVQDLRADLARLQESMNEMAGRLQALLSSPVPEDAGRASDLLEILTLRFENLTEKLQYRIQKCENLMLRAEINAGKAKSERRWAIAGSVASLVITVAFPAVGGALALVTTAATAGSTVCTAMKAMKAHEVVTELGLRKAQLTARVGELRALQGDVTVVGRELDAMRLPPHDTDTDSDTEEDETPPQDDQEE